MGDDRAYRIVSGNLYSRNFVDETLIVDTVSGLYFSLRGCAVDVWSLIEAGASLNEIVGEIGRRYDGANEEVVAATHRCVDELVAHNLIVESDAGAAEMMLSPRTDPKQPWAAPIIEQFTDMQLLLQLDPIHDVSDEGWPTPRQLDSSP
jgi:Coenzyme PQQ synthesis protein D (PqqD)